MLGINTRIIYDTISIEEYISLKIEVRNNSEKNWGMIKPCQNNANKAIEYRDVPTNISDPSAPTLASINDKLYSMAAQFKVL